MKYILLALSIVFFFIGCSSKTNRVYIDNYGICTNKSTSIYIDSIALDNQTKQLSIKANELQASLEKSMIQSGCFDIYNPSKSALLKDSTYLLNIKAQIFEEEEIIKDNIFKKDTQQKFIMILQISGYSGEKTINISTKSEIINQSSKVLGFEKDKELENDKNMLIQTAAKKATVILKENL